MRRPCARLRLRRAPRFSDGRADPGAGCAQQRSGEHEPRGIGETAGAFRHLGAVRVAVEDGEQPDHAHRGGNRRLDPQGHGRTQHDHGKRDAGFHDGQPGPGRAKRPAERQNGADHHHGQDVVEAGNRMAEAMREAAGPSGADTAEGWFALLSRRQLRRGVLRSTNELQAAIHAYIGRTNAEPGPFVRHKTADAIPASVGRSCQRTFNSDH